MWLFKFLIVKRQVFHTSSYELMAHYRCNPNVIAAVASQQHCLAYQHATAIVTFAATMWHEV